MLENYNDIIMYNTINSKIAMSYTHSDIFSLCSKRRFYKITNHISSFSA